MTLHLDSMSCYEIMVKLMSGSGLMVALNHRVSGGDTVARSQVLNLGSVSS